MKTAATPAGVGRKRAEEKGRELVVRGMSGSVRVRGVATAVIAVGLLGCGADPSGPAEPIEELPRELSAQEREISEAANTFAFDLLARVEAEEPADNLFLSPLSASMALGMAMVGAEGTTFDAMRSTLGFPGLAREEIGRGYRDLIELLLGLDPSVEIGIGNSVWIREGFPPLLPGGRGALVRQELDFGDPSAAETINGWVAEETNGRIEELVTPPIAANVIAFLINAIYFRGDWTEQFDPEETRDAPFTRPDGGTSTVRMMSRRGEIAHASVEGWQAVELPYGGQAFAMTLLLPDPDLSVEDLATSLDRDTWQAILGALAERDIRLSMPRFEITYEKVLNDVLQAMGMEAAFSNLTADFSRMVEGGGVWIDEVKQKSFVRVDEEGTEAAAATSVTIVESAPPAIVFDRPFLLVLRERLTGPVRWQGRRPSPDRGGRTCGFSLVLVRPSAGRPGRSAWRTRRTGPAGRRASPTGRPPAPTPVPPSPRPGPPRPPSPPG